MSSADSSTLDSPSVLMETETSASTLEVQAEAPTDDDDMMLPPPDLDVLTRSEFELDESPLGRGGFSITYKGRHNDLGHVAVKTLITRAVLSDKEIAKLKDDANQVHRLSHANKFILSTVALIMDRSYYSLVSQYMPFGNIRRFRNEFLPEWPLFIRITKDIIDGMKFLHSQEPSILHLNLKPENILLNKQVHAKVTGFGLDAWVTAGEAAGNDARQSATRMPPEHWSETNRQPDRGHDVYSFGIVLWEFLSGLSPFANVPEEVMKTAVMSGQRPDFANIPRDSPPILSGVMNKSWSQNLKTRPSFEKLGIQLDKGFKNIENKIHESYNKLRKEICRKYQPGELLFSETMELEMKEELSKKPTESTGTEVSAEPSEPEPEPELPKPKPPPHLVMDEERFTKYLFDTITLQLAKANLGSVSYSIVPVDFEEVMQQPDEFSKGLQRNLQLRLDIHKYNLNVFGSMTNSVFQRIQYKKRVETEEIETDFQNRSTFTSNYIYTDSGGARNKRRLRIKEQVKNNKALGYYTSQGSQKLIRLFQNPQILQDMAKGDFRRIMTMSPEIVGLALDPMVFISLLTANDEFRNQIIRTDREALCQLLSNPKRSSRSRPSSHNFMPGGGPSSRHRREMMRMGMPPSMMDDMDDMMMRDMEMDRHMMRRRGPKDYMDYSDDSDDDEDLIQHRPGKMKLLSQKMKNMLPSRIGSKSSKSMMSSSKMMKPSSSYYRYPDSSSHGKSKEMKVSSSSSSSKSYPTSKTVSSSGDIYGSMVSDVGKKSSSNTKSTSGMEVDFPDVMPSMSKRMHPADSDSSNSDPSSRLQYQNISIDVPHISASNIHVGSARMDNVQYGNKKIMIVDAEPSRPVRKKKKVTYTGQDRVPTRKQLDTIASHIGKKWRELLRYLEFEDVVIEQLYMDHDHGIYEVVYQGLQKWMKLQGSKASLKLLVDCLSELDKGDIAEKLL